MSDNSIPHHVSDVEHWGAPDRNYYFFVFMSIVFGFLGFDHFYLRSFGTGTQKFFTNIFTFGLWYFWDLIQIAYDGEKIRKEGLSSPLEWIRGIGRGTFKPLDGGGQPVSPTKSYILYVFLAVFFGWLGADKFYLGYGWQGLAKLLSTWNIFLFLFGWLWIFWDSIHAFFMTDSILKDGISPPLPFNMVFSEPITSEIFKVKPAEERPTIVCTEGPVWCTLDWIAKTFNFPTPPKGLPIGQIYKELVAPVLSVPLTKEVHKLREELISPQIPGLPALTPDKIIESLPTTVIPKSESMKQIIQDHPLNTLLKQRGGTIKDSENSGGPGPVIAGALTALVLAGGLKGFYDFLSKQYG